MPRARVSSMRGRPAAAVAAIIIAFLALTATTGRVEASDDRQAAVDKRGPLDRIDAPSPWSNVLAHSGGGGKRTVFSHFKKRGPIDRIDTDWSTENIRLGKRGPLDRIDSPNQWTSSRLLEKRGPLDRIDSPSQFSFYRFLEKRPMDRIDSAWATNNLKLGKRGPMDRIDSPNQWTSSRLLEKRGPMDRIDSDWASNNLKLGKRGPMYRIDSPNQWTSSRLLEKRGPMDRIDADWGAENFRLGKRTGEDYEDMYDTDSDYINGALEKRGPFDRIDPPFLYDWGVARQRWEEDLLHAFLSTAKYDDLLEGWPKQPDRKWLLHLLYSINQARFADQKRAAVNQESDERKKRDTSSEDDNMSTEKRGAFDRIDGNSYNAGFHLNTKRKMDRIDGIDEMTRWKLVKKYFDKYDQFDKDPYMKMAEKKSFDRIDNLLENSNLKLAEKKSFDRIDNFNESPNLKLAEKKSFDRIDHFNEKSKLKLIR